MTKNQTLLAYLVKNHPKASVTTLMKLAYLIDLISIQEGKNQIFNFKYKRYNYGPFDEHIYKELDELAQNNVIIPSVDYSPTGSEYVIYEFNSESELDFKSLDDEELSMINSVLEKVKGYGAKALTDIAYKTKPMLKLGATLGGNENLNAPLDLSAS
jgi:uncharacterized phage-associated protein